MTINEIWKEAKRHRVTLPEQVRGEYILYKGIKILNVSGAITILNTKKGGGFYKEITRFEYESFFRNGFKKGVAMIVLTNIAASLHKLNTDIMDEVSERRNPKRYATLLNKRDKLIIKHCKLKKEIL
jgi:hypothetical protein